MADHQFIEEMADNAKNDTRLEAIKTWIWNRKCQLTLVTLIIIAFAIILINSQQQAKLHEKLNQQSQNQSKLLSMINQQSQNQSKLHAKIDQLKEAHENETKINAKKISDLTESMNVKDAFLMEKSDFHYKAASAQSCLELYEHGFTKNGYYLVDPDGRYTGQAAFEVFCEVAKKYDGNPYEYAFDYTMTKIKPITRTFNISSQLSEDFSVEIEYNATSEQIQTLIDNSATCFQEITFDCLVMPLHFEDINHGYWKDRSGTSRFFFDGIDYKGRKCQCSNSDNGMCQSSRTALCNCDLRSKYESEDKGTIRAQWILPITGFGYNFHGHSLNTFHDLNGSATVTIGDLTCKGNNLITLVYPSNMLILQCNFR